MESWQNWTFAKITNLKPNDAVLQKKKRTTQHIVWSLFIFFSNFSWKGCLSGYFSCAFKASLLHQIWSNLYTNDHLIFFYNPTWFVQVDWHHKGRGADLKWSPQAALNCQIWQFMVPTSNQWLRSFPIESRSKSFLKWRQDCPLPPPIYRGEFHDLSMKKIGSKIAKSQLSAMFSLSFFSLHRGLRLPPQSPLAWPPSSLPTQLLTSDRATTVGPSFSSFSFYHRPQTLSSPPPLTLCHPPSPASHDHHVRLLPSLSS